MADNKAGYFGVTPKKRVRTKPYRAQVSRGGKNVHLGNFATAEEAALCIARSSEGRAAAAERPAKRARSGGGDGSMEAAQLATALAASHPNDDEDAQLQAAIAASLREAAPAGGSRGGGGGTSDVIDLTIEEVSK